MVTVPARSATDADEVLRTALIKTITDIVEDHPGPDTQTLVEDVADAVLDRLRLHASVPFVDRSAVDKTTFRTVTGRLDEEARDE